ncbi:hypothetical protein CRG98_019873 [Punica granatum]|uniref:Uncharacterized protein n=1 Tax=Punica granatum TaxID=22663 RepID=A0A2I0JTQ0_PUNGR|nr:hypothetical protein CRG98_019873 [Punica granatum]
MREKLENSGNDLNRGKEAILDPEESRKPSVTSPRGVQTDRRLGALARAEAQASGRLGAEARGRTRGMRTSAQERGCACWSADVHWSIRRSTGVHASG